MKEPYDPEQITHPYDVGRAALQVGGFTTIPGAIIGSVYGTLKTKTPNLFALASAAQCGILGVTYWTFRSCIMNRTGLQNWYLETRGLPLLPREDLNPTARSKVYTSVAAGALTGAFLGPIFRGPQNIIPGTIMFSLWGFLGQTGYNYFDERNSREVKRLEELRARGERDETFMERIAKKKWSPMKVLTDEEYETMLQEKLLKVEAEIAIVDEKIEKLRKQALGAQVKREVQEKA